MICSLASEFQFSRSLLVSVPKYSPSTDYLQGCNTEYAVSANRYNIFEDFGPGFSMVITPLTFVLFSAWPVAIGTVSFYYCGECLGLPSAPRRESYLTSHTAAMNIYLFYACDRRFRQLMSSTRLNRNRYIRLMIISATEILGTIPLATVYIVKNAKLGVDPWRGWAYTHEHYSVVYQVPASVWRNDPDSVFALEMYRWSLVLCAFLFFALFGFADEARQHYRRVYTSIASRVGYSTSTLFRSLQAYVIHSLRELLRLIVTHFLFSPLLSVLVVRRQSHT